MLIIGTVLHEYTNVAYMCVLRVGLDIGLQGQIQCIKVTVVKIRLFESALVSGW